MAHSNYDKAARSIQSDELWEWLKSDPHLGVSLLDRHLMVLFTNSTASRWFLDCAPKEVIGRRLDEFLPATWISERRNVLEQAATSRVPIQLRTVWSGRQLVSLIRPIQTTETVVHFLVITRHLTGPLLVTADQPVLIESEVADFGPLQELTPRELEVLALLGQGHPVKQVARIIHRSPRTVEVHKRAIGRKLQETDRVQLALIAASAGLTTRDAHRTRLSRR